MSSNISGFVAKDRVLKTLKTVFFPVSFPKADSMQRMETTISFSTLNWFSTLLRNGRSLSRNFLAFLIDWLLRKWE